MDFIIADSNQIELTHLSRNCDIDLDIGDTNDFQLTLPIIIADPDIYKKDNYLYCIGTEYGGIIKNREIDTKSNVLKLSGDTWRGMLSKKIVQPPATAAYLSVNGETNIVIASLIYGRFGDLVVAETTNSGINVSYQFNRYCTLLDGLNKMLDQYGMRLNIVTQYNAISQKMEVALSAVYIIDHSRDIETSQDGNVYFVMKETTNGINHLICLGKGELTDREVVHLYLQSDGTIGTTKYYTGVDEREATYENTSAEDTQALTDGGIEKFKELANAQNQSMTIEDMNVELYDLVGGREYITGITMAQPVTNKIVKIKNGKETVDYKIGGTA